MGKYLFLHFFLKIFGGFGETLYICNRKSK